MWTTLITWVINWLPPGWRPRLILKIERSSQWRKVRAEHLKKEPFCQACGRRANLEVHHIIPVSFCPHKELDPENLMTLCGNPCHFVFGHLMSYNCYNKDVRRMVAAYRAAKDKRICLERFP